MNNPILVQLSILSLFQSFIRNGLKEAFSLSEPSAIIHYSRLSSNHYTIPSPASIDLLFPIHSLIHSFISLIKSMPSCHHAAVSLVLFAHNLNGLLYHIPLFHLLFTHLRCEDDSSDDTGMVFEDDRQEESDEHFTFTRLMCLNVIVDLCRLLSRGYSHLYAVYGFLHESLKPRLGLSKDQITFDSEISTNQSDFIPMTYWEYVCLQYELYQNHGLDSDSSFLYLRYLQSLQKIVYLMIIDDFITVEIIYGLNDKVLMKRVLKSG